MLRKKGKVEGISAAVYQNEKSSVGGYMKYTNKHIKEEYKFNQIWRTIGMILLLIGIFLVGFGLIQTKRKMDDVRPFEQVLQEESNPANQTAYIDIIRVPEKLAENKYEGYYLVTTAEESYIVEMQPEQFVDLKQRVEENGTARVEGMTKVVIDENVKTIVSAYINHKFIAIRMTKLTYGKILKEGYFVNLDIGGILILIGISMVFIQVRAIKKFRHSLAEQIDEECNQPEALWFNEFRIYLTKNFLVSVYGGKLTALDLAKVQKTRLFETVKGSSQVITLEVTTTEQEKITVSENEWLFFTMNEEEIGYLTDVFGKRNIEFVCEIQPDEENDEDEEV